MATKINKGDAPLNSRQSFIRSERRYNYILSKAGVRPGDELALATIPHADLPQRLLDIIAALPGTSTTFAEVLLLRDAFINKELSTNNFNKNLHKYRKALGRLAQYQVANGRSEVIEQVPTGQSDEEGNPITEDVVTQTAIDPLDDLVEESIYDDEGVLTGTQMVTNPLILADVAERVAAQAIVDGTQQEVINHDL